MQSGVACSPARGKLVGVVTYITCDGEVHAADWQELTTALCDHTSELSLQVDFASSMATMLGVPIPYGNIGRVSPELLALGAPGPGMYLDALRTNAQQVMLQACMQCHSAGSHPDHGWQLALLPMATIHNLFHGPEPGVSC